MKPVHWVIQTNLLNDTQVNAIWYAAIEAGCEVHPAIVIPFQDELGNESEIPEMDGTVIPYGSCKLTKLSKKRGWNGNCYDENTFDVQVWNACRHDMLNSDAEIMRVKDTVKFFESDTTADEEDYWFIRPVKDLKEFSGTVAQVADIKNWMCSPKSGNFSFGDDTLIMLSPTKKIYSESRFFVVGGKVVDGSYYRMGGRLMSHHITQPELYALAQEIADKWLPHECCVMDLADTDQGVKVIEFNTINSSGFYDHDVKKIVNAMTEWGRK